MSLLMSLLSSIICFSRFLVILFGLSLTFTLFPLRDVHFCIVTDAPMSFPTLFIRSLVEVHRSNAKSHGLFFPFFYSRDFVRFRFRGFSLV